jgi:hypothetical protein
MSPSLERIKQMKTVVDQSELMNWREISPGIYSRQISEIERQVDMQFIERAAMSMDSSCVQLLVQQTIERLKKTSLSIEGNAR